MPISRVHQDFSNYLNNPEALTNPQDFLGPNCQTVLNFWAFMDSLTEDQWNEVARRYRALDYAALGDAWDAARDAAWGAARYASGAAARVAWAAAEYAAWDAAGVAAYATYELMGMHKLLNDGKTLFFVPLFNDL